jgi:hypothetical protein
MIRKACFTVVLYRILEQRQVQIGCRAKRASAIVAEFSGFTVQMLDYRIALRRAQHGG